MLSATVPSGKRRLREDMNNPTFIDLVGDDAKTP